MFIYKITNKINGKCYIGQTKKSINKRFNEHCLKNSGCTLLKHAIQKYGKENFEIKVLVICSNKQELNDREDFCIRIFKSIYPYGYNLIESNQNRAMTLHYEKSRPFLGKKHSKEALQKISESAKGRIPYNKGIQMSEDFKQKCKNRSKHLTKKIINLETGEIANSISELSNKLNINRNTLKGWLGAFKQNNKTNWQYKNEEE